MDQEPERPTIKEMEEVNDENVRRVLTPPRSGWQWIAGIAFFLVTSYVGNAVFDRLAHGLDISADKLVAYAAVGMMALIAIVITSASGSVFGVQMFRGEQSVPPSFRRVMGVTQAFMVVAAVALIATFIQ